MQTKRIVIIQGPIQLLNVLSVLSYQLSTGEYTDFEDTFVFGGMFLKGDNATEIIAVCTKILKIWCHPKKIYIFDDSMEERLAKGQLTFSQCRQLLSNRLNIKSVDVIYFCRNWQFINELFLSTYSTARKICYGDGLGFLDLNSKIWCRKSLNPDGFSRVDSAYLITPVESEPEGRSFDICGAIVIVPHSFFNIVLKRSTELISGLKQFAKELAAQLSNSYSLVLTSTYFESKMISNINDEISMYVEVILRHTKDNESILIKRHPREFDHKSSLLLRRLTSLKRRPYLLNSLSLLPIEFFLKDLSPEKAITFCSSAAISIALLKRCNLIVGMGERLIKKYLFEQFHNNALINEACMNLLVEQAYSGSFFPIRSRDVIFRIDSKEQPALHSSSKSLDGSSKFEEYEIVSPLNKSDRIRRLRSICSRDIIAAYKAHFDIPVAKLLSSIEEVSLYECCDTGYRFYYPFHISGDSVFYEQLEKVPWYYTDWKYEHDVASRFIDPGQTILEIGCAKGTFLEALRTRGIAGVGLELNEKAISVAQSKQLEIHQHTIQEHAARYSQRYDAVCAFQVLEHISDVKTFIEASLVSLKPNGIIILSVPNHDAFMGLDDRNTLDMPPHHMGIWNEKSLKSITKIFDLSLVKVINEPLQPYHLDYYASLVKKQFATDAVLQSALIKFAHNHPEKIKGFTTVAVFKKDTGASSRSRAAGDEPARFSSSHCITDAKMPIETRCLKSLTCHPPLFDRAVSCIKQSKIAEALALLTEELKANPDNELANALITFIRPPENGRPAIRNFDQAENHLDPKSSIESFAQKAEHRNLRHAFLNLGCGNHYHFDWTNVDFKSTHPSVIECDLNTGIPFPDNTFDAVYHSHLLEHFHKHFALEFLKDCHRVLKPGGVLRVVVPDLEQIARWYLVLLEKAQQGDLAAQRRYEWIMLEMFDQMVRNHSGGEMLKYWRQNPMPAEDFVIERMGGEVLGMIQNLRRQATASVAPISQNQRNAEQIGQFRLSGEIHHWMYDRYSLGKLLGDAGFCKISVRRADESGIAGFNKFHLDMLPDGSVRKPDSLFMEANKGSSV